jgi:hypothetical protein
MLGVSLVDAVRYLVRIAGLHSFGIEILCLRLAVGTLGPPIIHYRRLGRMFSCFIEAQEMTYFVRNYSDGQAGTGLSYLIKAWA